jgi:hypothetical protein
MKRLGLILIILCAFQVRAQGLISVLSTLDVHPVVGFSVNINSQYLVGPSWGINVATVDRFSGGVGFTRSGFGPYLGFRLVWILNLQGQWNALLFNPGYRESRFAVGLFIPV